MYAQRVGLQKTLKSKNMTLSCILLFFLLLCFFPLVSGLGVDARDVTAPKNSNTKCHEDAFLLGVLPPSQKYTTLKALWAGRNPLCRLEYLSQDVLLYYIS